MSNLITINASEARSDFFNILNEVYSGNKSFEIKKSGIVMAKIIAPDKISGEDFEETIDKYFGSIPDFPDVVKERVFRKRKISL